MNLSNDTGWPRHVLKAAEGIWSRLHTTGREPRQFGELDIDTLDDLCIQAENALRAEDNGQLAYLIGQYDRLLAAHERVVMDSEQDRELHARAIATFRAAVEPIRSAKRPGEGE